MASLPTKTAQTSAATTFNQTVEIMGALKDEENETSSPAHNANTAQSNGHQFQLGHDDDSIHHTYLAMAQMHSNNMSNNENFLNEQGMVSFQNLGLILDFVFQLF